VTDAGTRQTGPDQPGASRSTWLGAVFGLWIAAAAITGFLHGVELLVARYGFGRLVWFSREFAWMSPIAYALVMAPAAVVLAALSVTVRRTWVLACSAAAFATMGVFGLLLPYSQISRVSSLILALGVAVVLARSVHARPGLWVRRSRVASLGLAAFPVMAPAIILAASRISRAVQASSAPSATNVLEIIRHGSRGVDGPDPPIPRP
jgi:hypothetical protein